MRQDNGQVHQPQGSVGTIWAKKGEAVNDVQWKPADCKQPDDDGQRLGCMDFLLQRGARALPMYHLVLHLLELAPGCHEDFQVDTKHEKEGQEHTGKEVVVDHVLHGDHGLEETRHHAVAAVDGRGPVGMGLLDLGTLVPPQHRGQADDEGQHPADGNDAFGSRASHQAIVPAKQRRWELCQCHSTSCWHPHNLTMAPCSRRQ